MNERARTSTITPTYDVVSTARVGALRALREVAEEGLANETPLHRHGRARRHRQPGSRTDKAWGGSPDCRERMFRVAEAQARLLRELLPVPAEEMPEHLSNLIPRIVVEYLDDIPIAGTAFWARQRWHIHVRATASPARRAFAVLHELKHIIDHPWRRASPEVSPGLWEEVADWFAAQVIGHAASHTTN